MLFCVGPSFAGNTGKIAGVVTDQETGDPLPGANVLVTAQWANGVEIPLQSPTGTAAGTDGDYFILNLRPGLYTVQAVYVGYKSESVIKVQVVVDKTTRLDFTMEAEVFESDEITVTAYKPDEVEVDVTATKQVYDINEVQAIAGVSDINDILQLQADVVDDHFRGGRLGESTYLLGGGSIINPLNNRRAFRPIVTGLEQVEVYTSGFSAEYGNAQSGVVNMVTKEGTGKWKSRMEVASTLPYYKTWQGSPYDEDNLYFLNLLNNEEEWLKENPTNPGKPLYDAGYGFGPTYLPYRVQWPPLVYTHEDSLKIAKLGQILWMQSMREVGLEERKSMDYRIDFTTGGPLTDKTTIFLAARQEIESPAVPTIDPDRERQFMLNLTYRPADDHKIKTSFIYDNQFENDFSNYLRYMFDRTLNVPLIENVSRQYGLGWNYVFNNSTYTDVQVNVLDLLVKERVTLMEPGTYIEDYSNKTNWTDYTGPSYHRVGRPADDQGDQKSRTYDMHANIVSQVNRNNLIKAGFQFAYYDIDVDMDMNFYSSGNYRKVKFKVYPYEGAFYVQDKMEFSGLIANLGLRLDFYDLNTEYFGDTFSPLRQPDFKKETEPYVRLQPRIGISFPVSSTSVFHLNYGTFTQRPNFNQLFYNQITTNNDVDVLGNPRLKPENTNAYDIGLVQGLPFGFRLDVSAYYKDVKDLVESAYYEDSKKEVYRTYINRDYADIKGFHLSLEKITGNWRGYVRYNYESATGKSSNALDAPVTYYEIPDPKYGSVQLPDPEDVYLDYDRTHKLLFNLRYRTGNKGGIDVFGYRPLADFSISSTFRLNSGRPYTWDETGQGLKFNRRSPDEREWKLRIQKMFRFDLANVTVYAEGFNLLNEKFYHYSRTFDDERETARWHYDRENILIYNEYEPYTTSQGIYLLRNEPRHYRLGLIFNF